jgi:hypothetical protein
MNKVRKPINSVCYTPSSEPYRIYFLSLNHYQINTGQMIIYYGYNISNDLKNN